MFTSADISNRFWNLPQKASEELNREQVFMDDIIAKAHIQREIFSHLQGVKTVFDGGAGYGRFSIPLAKQGIEVTHFDISLPMIEAAKQLAAEAGVMDNMHFVHGSLEDLSTYQAVNLIWYFHSMHLYHIPIPITRWSSKIWCVSADAGSS